MYLIKILFVLLVLVVSHSSIYALDRSGLPSVSMEALGYGGFAVAEYAIGKSKSLKANSTIEIVFQVIKILASIFVKRR